jgi:hypothetical protein
MDHNVDADGGPPDDRGITDVPLNVFDIGVIERLEVQRPDPALLP